MADTPDEYRVSGWSHPTWQDNQHRVRVCKAVPHQGLAVVVRSLFRDGAVKLVIESEATIAAAELQAAIDAGEVCPSTLKKHCGACSGEACFLCGAGCWDTAIKNCDHDVIDRHRERPS